MSKTNNYVSLGNNATELLDGNSQPGVVRLQDYKHAANLYVNDHQIRAPKYGFLYFVKFIINRDAQINDADFQNIGVFVKKVDLPRFSLQTEMINQYNRKTQVHTRITYNPITIDFHDDTGDQITDLWQNYYRSIIADGNYISEDVPRAFNDTKFGNEDYEYGIYNNGVKESFFKRIDIYTLNHTQQTNSVISIINPKITEWKHDSLSQDNGQKVLQNSMTLVYESVIYGKGNDNRLVDGFVNEFYDKSQSPLKPAGNPVNDPGNFIYDRPGNAAIFPGNQLPIRSGNPLFDKSGRARAYNVPGRKVQSLFDRAGAPRQYGLINPPYVNRNPILDVAGILAKEYINKNGLGRVGPRGYNIASSAINGMIRNPAGKYYDPPPTQNVPGVFNLPGGIGINVFKALNTGVDGKIRVNPAAIIFPPKR